MAVEERDARERQTKRKEWREQGLERVGEGKDGDEEIGKHLHEPPTVWTSGTKTTQGFLDVSCGILIQKAWIF